MSDREKAMDERKRRMTQWYDHIADAYDQHRLPLSPRLAEALVRHAAVSEGERVLDVGTGTGNVAIAAARHTGARGRVVAIDLSRAMLGRARRKAGICRSNFLRWTRRHCRSAVRPSTWPLADYCPTLNAH